MIVDLCSCCVFSRVCLCLVFCFVRERPPLWRGFATVSDQECVCSGLVRRRLVTSRIGIKKTFDVILENTVCQGKNSPKG